MPRRRRYYADDDDSWAAEEQEELQEPEDVRAAPGIPTLYEIRLHIRAHAWNGQDFEPGTSNYMAFKGQCEYASTTMSEMLTGTGHNTHPRKIDWSLRVRGWYCGDLSDIKMSPACDEHAFSEGKHCHSWVEYQGKIYDPTWWQFAGGEVKVYVFELGDPRFIRDPEA